MPDHNHPPSGPAHPANAFNPPSVQELATEFPRYELVELIGHGGMGAVYKARQPKLDRLVAIKILPKNLGQDQSFAERFEREARAMAKLHHSRIITVHDFGETSGGYLYIVMEFVRGTTLLDLIRKDALEHTQILAIVTQICDALKYAHEHGVIHRDIKPANIMLDVEGQVKVADFGLAKLADSFGGRSITQTNVALGTPDYVAPEALTLHASVDQRADIYALGVLIYEMLTGKVPRGVFVPPSSNTKDMDPRLDDVVMRAMQAEPEDRYQQVTQLWTDVDRIRTTAAPSLKTSSPSPSPTVGKKTISPKTTNKTVHNEPKTSPYVIGGIATLMVATAAAVWALVANIAPHASPTPPESVSEEEQNASLADKTPPVSPPEEAANPPPTIVPPPKSSGGRTADTPRDQMRKDLEVAIENRSEEIIRPQTPPKKRISIPPQKPRRPNISKLRDRPRQTSGNVLIARMDGKAISREGLADLPEDLDQVVDIQLSQIPSLSDEAPFAVALLADGTIRVWGTDDKDLLEVPEEIGRVKKIAAGLGHILALRDDGTVIAWGTNAAGQSSVPEGLTNVAEIAAGGQHSLALLTDGTVVTWGADSMDSYNQPPDSLATGSFVAIHARGMHSIALEEDGSIVAWGDADHGITEPPPGLNNVTAVTSTWNTAAALHDDGQVTVWGSENNSRPVPSEKVVELQSTLESLLMRTESGRWIVRVNNSTPITFPSPAFGRPATRVIPSGEFVFAYYAPDTGIPAQGSSAPVITDSTTSSSEGSAKLAELIDTFRTGFEETLLKSHLEAIADLDEKYLAAIDREQIKSSEVGDLDSALAFRTEAERVSGNQMLPPTDPPDLPPRLLELRQTYREQLGLLKADLAENALSLLPPFDNALAGIESEFTRAQQLDDAIIIRSAREDLVSVGLSYFLGPDAPELPPSTPLDDNDILDSLEEGPLPFSP